MQHSAKRDGWTIVASRLGSFVSPDGRYLAKVTVGEAEASDLRVTDLRNKKSKPLISEWDVTGVIWDPDSPHRLVYSESGIYGIGKIVEWSGRKQTILWKRDLCIDNMRWDLRGHRLSFNTETINPPDRNVKYSIAIK